ncbi:hypothetical protein D9619_004544 [Psilocybe cf. subviscida]|uniref:Methyltransferase type 11 domain-containing protein n=1 Tax=Psilocybe cf. subviscida TaxID=2480587 RepID=A0A8H5BPI2_9AGAR|nr:hypothetical protein D9619_004544 [Psilocybe cf. subviscida]
MESVDNKIHTLHLGFWDYGHELFKSNSKTFPAGFVAGDIFDPSTLAPRGAYIDSTDIDTISSERLAPLQDLTSLTPLLGNVSAIHTASFFHLFSEEKQLDLARRVSSLLVPKPGSIIFGSHFALPEMGFRSEGGREWKMFCHSPETWKDMWLEVFDCGDGKGAERVRVDTQMFRVPIQGLWVTYTQLSDKSEVWIMRWSVTRI